MADQQIPNLLHALIKEVRETNRLLRILLQRQL